MYNTILKWFAGGSRTHDKPNLQWHINMYVGSTRSNAQLLSLLLWTWHCCHLTPIFILFWFYLSWKLIIVFCSGTWELLHEVRKAENPANSTQKREIRLKRTISWVCAACLSCAGSLLSASCWNLQVCCGRVDFMFYYMVYILHHFNIQLCITVCKTMKISFLWAL